MTLTDAFNTFIQQFLNVEGLPFIVTKNSKEALMQMIMWQLFGVDTTPQETIDYWGE